MTIPYKLICHLFDHRHLFFELVAHISVHVVQKYQNVAHLLSDLRFAQSALLGHLIVLVVKLGKIIRNVVSMFSQCFKIS